MEIMTTKQAAERWVVTTRQVQLLCDKGNVAGVVKFGSAWAIPINAGKPIDRRVKKGKSEHFTRKQQTN
jgi:hypothetical protein